MSKRRFLRICIIAVVIATATPLCFHYLGGSRSRPLELLATACFFSLLPALWVAGKILPPEYFAITPPDFDFARQERGVWSIAIPADVDRMRRRMRASTSNQTMH